MNRKLLLLAFLVLTLNIADAQYFHGMRYFDGADTLVPITIHFDTTAGNTWQIGRPQKTIFDSAATFPNALMTDTVNTYPANNLSRFTIGFNFKSMSIREGVVAFRWMQKLDLDTNRDGAIVEYSSDTGKTWKNVINNGGVYNLYGFHTSNRDTLYTGEYVLSGVDSVWRDVWFCMLSSVSKQTDSFIVRFTLKTDSIDNNREGWIIDNMLVQRTVFHTVNTVDSANTFMVYPTITSGIVNVTVGDNTKQVDHIVVLDAQGRVARRYNEQTEKAVLDISALAPGNYYLHVQADNKIEVHKIVLQH